MSPDSLEKAYFNKDLSAFVQATKKAAVMNQIDREYNNTNPLFDNLFRKGSALTTISALAPFDITTIPFVQALLEAGADPNYTNLSLGGLSVLENLIVNAQPNFVYADPDSLQESLTALIKLLVNYGADTQPYEGVGGDIPDIIDNVLLEYAGEIDGTDSRELQMKLCEDLSKQNNLAQLKLLAKSLGLTTAGKKADLCSIISQQLLQQV